MTYFLFLRSLVSAAGKCLLTLFCTLLAPMVQCAVGDSQIACNLRLRFVARSHQLDRFLLKFSRKGSLLLLHDPFPFCGESTLSSLHPPLLWVKTKLLPSMQPLARHFPSELQAIAYTMPPPP